MHQILGAAERGRLTMGVPATWSRVEYILHSSSNPGYPKSKVAPEFKKTWVDIPTLDDYSKDAPDEFWEKFPHSPVPSGVTKRVDEKALASEIDKVKPLLTRHQIHRADRLLEDLAGGAQAYQLKQLPPVKVPNAQSAFEHGEMLTDKLATWVHSGIARGPFRYPPLPGFRANSLMAIEKNGAVRPIIHMTKPKGFSFNDNLDVIKMEKVHMNVARDFGYLLRESGKGTIMSKYDLKDAFKLIPAKPRDWKLQGFFWAGRYFFESNMIFGASPSVSNFDRLANTLVEVAAAHSGMPRKYILRTLDDIPVVAPVGKDYTIRFGKALRDICSRVGVKLADNCPAHMKAFEHVHQGVVLGIGFNAEEMTWFLPEEKADRFLRRIIDARHTDYMNLKQTQGIMGVVNDLILMAGFMKPFRVSGNKMLHELGSDEDKEVMVTAEFKSDLGRFARLVQVARGGLPICSKPSPPPLFSRVFFSDAAGANFAMCGGERVNLNTDGDRGVACIEVEQEKVKWWADLFWPKSFLEQATDSKGAHYGSKTTTLEAIGVLLPFLCIPEELVGQHLVFTVDNIAVVYGWDNRCVKFDDAASIILRAVHLIASYLGSVVHITHSPRRSTQWEILVDNLSRMSSRSHEDRGWTREARKSVVLGALICWLKKPSEDWNLPYVLLGEVKKKIKL
jgi:hypothetical protein